MAKLTIGQVARKTGLAASAIRYYEREGLIPAAPKEGGRRVYPSEILDRLALIELAKQAGMTIRESKRLFEGLSDRQPAAQAWEKMTGAKLLEIDERIASLTRMKRLLNLLASCECGTLDDCGRALREQSTAS